MSLSDRTSGQAIPASAVLRGILALPAHWWKSAGFGDGPPRRQGATCLPAKRFGAPAPPLGPMRAGRELSTAKRGKQRRIWGSWTSPFREIGWGTGPEEYS